MCRIARERGARPVAVTFDRHPLEIVAPERAPLLLTLPGEQEKLLEKSGVEVLRINFDESTRRLTAAEWMKRLRDEQNMSVLVVGYDNTFGSDGLCMSLSDYADIGRQIGVEVVQAPVVDGISSSAVRRAVAAGDVKKAAEMLGRPYELNGAVVHGNALGRTIGWPTANLAPDARRLIPSPGVYAAGAVLPDGKNYPAVVNIGNRPTVAANAPLSIEAYIIGWSGSLYGLELRLRFLSRLRDEKRFGSLELLKEEIAADVSRAGEIYSEASQPDTVCPVL